MNHTCPRRHDNFLPAKDEKELDNYRADGTCSYCGSLNPTTFMARLRAGDIELGPTDKGYKVYVRNSGGQLFSRQRRIDNDHSNDRTKWIWEMQFVEQTKFYFQHLDNANQEEFIQIVNKGTKIGYPGHFYTLPYFTKRI